jgi:hypothetical protein
LDIRFESIKLEIDLCVKELENLVEKLAQKRFNKLIRSLKILLLNVKKRSSKFNLDLIQTESKKYASFSLFDIENMTKIIYKNDIGYFKVSLLTRN